MDLVLDRPGLTRVFERLGIDYCCDGELTLADACSTRGFDLDTVLGAVDQASRSACIDADWRSAPLRELCSHLVDRHHQYLREELPSLLRLVEHVTATHRASHPELSDVRATFSAVARRLEKHVEEQEHVLFPACAGLDGSEGAGPDVSVTGAIRAAALERDAVAAGLHRLRSLTGGYEPPLDARNSYRAMLDRLATLDADTHLHLHTETSILYPRVAALNGGTAR